MQLLKSASKRTIIISVGITLFLVGTLIYPLIGKSGFTSTETPAEPVAVSEQTALVTQTLPSEPAVGDVTSYSDTMLPVTIVPITDFLNMLKQKIGDPFTSASMNDQKSVTAVATEDKILAARYLPQQADILLQSYQNASMPVAVSAGTAATTTTGSPAVHTGAASTTGSNMQASTGSTLLVLLVVVVIGFGLISGIGFFLVRRQKRAAAALQKEAEDAAAAAALEESENYASFSDVAGCDEAIDELKEMVEFLRDPDVFTRVGATPPRGALLVGPPGTGKTLLARAVAGEAGVPFYSTSGSDFVEKYVGVGSKNVRELFAKARAHEEGAIVFIDEIDSVGRKRSSGDNHHQEQESTLNALLVEMDGFRKSKVIVIGATNRDDILDPALLRPDRLSKRVHVPLPDRRGRERILLVHMGKRPVSTEVNVDLIARRTPGMSGAELAQIVNEACMQTARDKRDQVSSDDFEHAVATVAMGRPRTSAVVTDTDRQITAWHEAGHTAAAMVLTDADEAVSVSIIPRGAAGGITWMASGDDQFLTRKRALARLVVAMSGRAAEEIHLNGEFTSGPHGDLQAATETAFAMVTKYGMTSSGLMIRSDGLLSTGSKVTDSTVEEVEKLLAEALTMARNVLASHMDLMNAIVTGLLENDTLNAEDLRAIARKFAASSPILPAAPTEYRKTTPPVMIPLRPPEHISAKSRAAGRPKMMGAVATILDSVRGGRRAKRDEKRIAYANHQNS